MLSFLPMVLVMSSTTFFKRWSRSSAVNTMTDMYQIYNNEIMSCSRVVKVDFNQKCHPFALLA